MNKAKFVNIIKRAEKGGYKNHLKMLPTFSPLPPDLLMEMIFWSRRYEIIFSHDFAKAFWGNSCGLIWSPFLYKCGFYTCEWKHHLQQMVLEEEPLKYLEKCFEN